MDTNKLRQKILDLAIHGKLVPQDPNDEPASVLIERIKAEKVSKNPSDKRHYENIIENVPFE
ncbi:MAG: restriction endonuclease subunit S, partial [Paludibacteraceae bacterium]|nr:restriction endonuclease subunit S [Paludibacteraceae bacterium]